MCFWQRCVRVCAASTLKSKLPPPNSCTCSCGRNTKWNGGGSAGAMKGSVGRGLWGQRAGGAGRRVQSARAQRCRIRCKGQGTVRLRGACHSCKMQQRAGHGKAKGRSVAIVTRECRCRCARGGEIGTASVRTASVRFSVSRCRVSQNRERQGGNVAG